jgi:hypothetical protein
MIIAREQEKFRDLRKVMRNSNTFKYVTIEGETLVVHEGKHIPGSLIQIGVW